MGETTMVMSEQPVKNESKKANNGNAWKQVTIGGISGIALGSIATAAVAATTEGESADVILSGVNGVAHVDSSVPFAEVNDDMSFGEAFTAAREQVGAGGVFVWHGQVYNTYTAEEWNRMTPAEHAEFGSHVNVIYDEPGHDTQTTTQSVTATVSHESETTSEPDVVVAEPEVEILGVKVVHTENGDMTLGGMTVNGKEYVLIDVDGGDFDIAWHDDNHDSQMQETELADIREGHISVNDFAQAANHADGANSDENLTVGTDMDSVSPDEIDGMDASDMSILI